MANVTAHQLGQRFAFGAELRLGKSPFAPQFRRLCATNSIEHRHIREAS